MDPAPNNDEEVFVKKLGNRHVQLAFLFSACSLCMAQRTTLSVAIVAMTAENSTSPNPDVPLYDWTNASIILGAFFYCYLVFQIPAGFLARIFSAKHILLWSFLINTIAYILLPLFADFGGSIAVIFLRVLQGLGQGCFFPCAQTITGRWAPPSERSTFGGIIFSGINAGTVLAFFTTGFICSSWPGWPLAFYLWGVVGAIWCVLYFFFGFSRPSDNPRISPSERDYIERSLHQTGIDKEPKLPIKQILRSMPFWATVFGNIGNVYCYATMMTQVSIYFGKVMKFSINENGMVSACPYIGAFLMGWIFSPLSDYIIQKHWMKRINVRRLFQCGGAYGMGIIFIMVGYFSNTQLLAVVLVTLANMFYAATLCAYPLSQTDISPRFCGIMYGISNTIGCGFGLLSPIFVQFIVTDMTNQTQWQIVFIKTAAVYIVSATLYAVFLSADRQHWDSVEEVEPKPTSA